MEQKLYPTLSPSAPYDNDLVESMINKQLQSALQSESQKVNSFNNSIQNISLMMKYYEMEEEKYKQKYTKYKLINNLIHSLDGIIVIRTTSTSVTLSITGVGIIVVPIAAGVGCATGILGKIFSSYLKKKEQNYELKYVFIQKTLDDFRQLYTASLKDNYVDEKEYHRFVTQFENYRVASQTASQSQSKSQNNIANQCDTRYEPNTFL